MDGRRRTDIWITKSLPELSSGETKRGLFLTPVLTIWVGGHIDHHVWRRVIVPSDLAR